MRKFLLIILFVFSFNKISAQYFLNATGAGIHQSPGFVYSFCPPTGAQLTVTPFCSTCSYSFFYMSTDGTFYSPFHGPNSNGTESLWLGSGVYSCAVFDGVNTYPTNSVTVFLTDSIGSFYPVANSYQKLSVTSQTCGQANLKANYTQYPGYQWLRNNVIIPGATSAFYNATLSGNYTCRLYNACGWSYSDTLKVAVSNNFSKPAITSPSPFSNCNNQQIVLSITPVSGAKYKWVKNGLYNAASFIDSSSIVSTGTADYTVVVSNLCKTDTSAIVRVTVNTNSLPTAVVTPANPPATCNSFVALNTNASPGLYDVQWNLNGSVIAGANSSSYAARTSGNYSVTFSNVCGSSNTSAIVPVTLYANPSTAIQSNGATAFLQGDSVELETTAGVGYSYQWMKNDVVLNSTNRKIYAKGAGDYKVIVTNANGCTASSSQIGVTINKNKYVANLILQPDSSGKDCYVSSFSPSFTSPDNKLLYVGVIEYLVNDFYHLNGLIEFNLSVLPLNSIIEDARLSLYCDSYLIPARLQNKNLMIQRNTSAWQEKTVNWYTHPSADTLHQVTIPLAPATVKDYRNINVKQLVKDMLPGSAQNFGFQLKILEDIHNGDNLQFISSDDERSTYRPRLVISYTPACPATVSINSANAISICSGDSVELKTDFYPGYSYQWKNNGVNINGATNASYFVKTAGNYRVVVVTSCGTKNSQLVNVSVKPLPAANITSASPTTFCSGLTDTLNATNGSGLAYKWYRYNTLIPGANLNSYPATLTGSYKVTITNAQGCSKTSNQITLTVNPKPTATITPQGPLSFCAGDSVKLFANSGSGLSYQWRRNGALLSGFSVINYTAKTAGNYSVIVTNANGCTKLSSPAAVSVPCRIENELSERIIVYPNPSNNSFIIQLNDETEAHIIVRDMTGRLVEERGNFHDNETIGETWPAGVYLLQLNVGDKSRVIKLVKSSSQ